MKRGILILAIILALAVSAQASPVACNGTASTGAVTSCNANQTYGCTAGTTATQILSFDGARTTIWFQNTGSNPITLAFGDTATTSNGFVVQPQFPFFWTNLSQGNVPGHISPSTISIITTTGASACVFMFGQ